MLFIILGSKIVHKPVKNGWRGRLNCPQCREPRLFVEMQPVTYFTLYWLPIFPTSRGEHYIECKQCGGKFNRPDELSSLPRS